MTGSSRNGTAPQDSGTARHGLVQKEAGIDIVPAGDFSLYDQVLDTACMVGAVPEHYGWNPEQSEVPLFAMALGTPGDATRVLEMTKWFDTNSHCIVSELRPSQGLHLASCKVIEGRRFVP